MLLGVAEGRNNASLRGVFKVFAWITAPFNFIDFICDINKCMVSLFSLYIFSSNSILGQETMGAYHYGRTTGQKPVYFPGKKMERHFSIKPQLYHSMAGLEVCPVNHPFVKSSLEGAKRKLARPVRPKEPLSVDTVQAIAEFYVSSNSLATLRFLFVLLVGFYVFFVLMKLTVFAFRM